LYGSDPVCGRIVRSAGRGQAPERRIPVGATIEQKTTPFRCLSPMLRMEKRLPGSRIWSVVSVVDCV
jgi:hypothetical protein